MFDVISGAVLALQYGYLMLPSAIAYLLAADLSLLSKTYASTY